MNADIIIRGRGIHPEHCYFIHERDVVMLFPLSQLITVDGAKVTRPTILSQGIFIHTSVHFISTRMIETLTFVSVADV